MSQAILSSSTARQRSSSCDAVLIGLCEDLVSTQAAMEALYREIEDTIEAEERVAPRFNRLDRAQAKTLRKLDKFKPHTWDGALALARAAIAVAPPDCATDVAEGLAYSVVQFVVRHLEA